LRAVANPGDKDDYFAALQRTYSTAVREKSDATGLPPTLQNYASRATCQLQVENLASGSISITTEILPPDGENKVVQLASYTPAETDIEIGDDSINYFSLLSSIGPKEIGGPISSEALLRRSNINFGNMPPRNHPDTTEYINNYLSSAAGRGELASHMAARRDGVSPINFISVGNYTEKIETNLDTSYIQEVGKNRLTPFIKAINKNPFNNNEDKCVTQEEVYLASSVAMVIQSRLQDFFLNTLPLTRVYPQWGGLGTTKLIGDYISRKIISELEEQGIINQIYDNLEAYQKVYIDNPDNTIFRKHDEPDKLSIDMGAPPRQILSSIIEKTYSSILDNISRVPAFSGINKSPYSANITNTRYKTTLSRLFLGMKEQLEYVIDGNSPITFGLTSSNFGSIEHYVPPNILDRPEINAPATPTAGRRLIQDLAEYYLSKREYTRFLASHRDYVPPDENPDFVYMRQAIAMIENNLLDDNSEVTNLGMMYGAYYLPISLLYALYLISYDHVINLTTNFGSGRMRSLIEKYGADDTFLSAAKGITVNQFSKNLEGMPASIETKRVSPSSLEEYNRLKAERRQAIETLRQQLSIILPDSQVENVLAIIVNSRSSGVHVRNALWWMLPLLVFIPVWLAAEWYIENYIAPGDDPAESSIEFNRWSTTYYDRKDVRARIDTLSAETATDGKIKEFLSILKNKIGLRIGRVIEEDRQNNINRDDPRISWKVGDIIAHDFIASIIDGESREIKEVYPSVETFVTATPENPLDADLLISGYEDFLSSTQYTTMASPNNLTRASREYRNLPPTKQVAHLLSVSLSKRLEDIMLDRESKLAEKIELEDLLTI